MKTSDSTEALSLNTIFLCGFVRFYGWFTQRRKDAKVVSASTGNRELATQGFCGKASLGPGLVYGVQAERLF